MRSRSRVTFALAIAAAVMALVLANPGSGRAAEEAISVGDFFFCDASFQSGVCETTIAAGDTVTWSVAGGFHTVTACDESFATCPSEGGFDSGQLIAGGQFQQTFDSPGTFNYRCNNHPFLMRGTITVEAQDTPTPQPTAAPTASASATPAPSAAATPTPASVPETGREPSGGDASGLAIALAGALAVGAAGVVLLRGLRRTGA